jgi:hypothetical protein
VPVLSKGSTTIVDGPEEISCLPTLFSGIQKLDRQFRFTSEGQFRFLATVGPDLTPRERRFPSLELLQYSHSDSVRGILS